MPTSPVLKAKFQPQQFYHIVTKSIDGLLLFNEEADYTIFLERFKLFGSCFFDVLSYILLPNHTHHIIYTKPAEDIIKAIGTIPREYKTKAMSIYISTPTPEHFNRMIER